MPEFIGFADFAKLAEIEPPLPTIEGLPILVNPLFFGVLPVAQAISWKGRQSRHFTQISSNSLNFTSNCRIFCRSFFCLIQPDFFLEDQSEQFLSF